VRLPRLQMRRLQVRLERLRGLWRLWRLLRVLGTLPLVLEAAAVAVACSTASGAPPGALALLNRVGHPGLPCTSS